jgi:3-hydroxyisobutyrate dehydrogenase-like beta-hydroxyacid dehydrogenase
MTGRRTAQVPISQNHVHEACRRSARTAGGRNMKVAVFGLGEAGSRFAADLVREGHDVRGFDPAGVPTPAGVVRAATPTEAVPGVELVIALTAAADAPAALVQAVDTIPVGAVYADLGTGSAGLKKDLARTAKGRGLLFADVALMATVPGKGLRTPALVSGEGAERYLELMAPFGVVLESVGPIAGDAATRKLLRSVFMKGFAAVVIEAMRAAEAAGQADWLWANIVDEITAAGAPLVSRLVRGTAPHALRRLHEMEASAALLVELGVDPLMTRSTVESLRRVMRDGLPGIPFVADE